MENDLSTFVDTVLTIARQAGDVIIPYYGQLEKLQIEKKQDLTLVTKADLSSNDLIVSQLEKHYPHIPIVSEEGKLPLLFVRESWKRLWLLDPLDGTRGFVSGSKNFTINIALVEKNHAIFGLIYAPIKNIFYYAWQGGGAYKKVDKDPPQIIHTRAVNWQQPTALTGRRLYSKRVKQALTTFPSFEMKRVNSSIKFGYIAEGLADVYPSVGKTSEWDSAAGQIIIEEAGGKVVDFTGEPLQYNLKDSWDNPKFIAVGDPTGIDRWLSVLQSKHRHAPE